MNDDDKKQLSKLTDQALARGITAGATMKSVISDAVFEVGPIDGWFISEDGLFTNNGGFALCCPLYGGWSEVIEPSETADQLQPGMYVACNFDDRSRLDNIARAVGVDRSGHFDQGLITGTMYTDDFKLQRTSANNCAIRSEIDLKTFKKLLVNTHSTKQRKQQAPKQLDLQTAKRLLSRLLDWNRDGGEDAHLLARLVDDTSTYNLTPNDDAC